MNKPFVSLRPEITRTHAWRLMEWLEDEQVTRYLSDSVDVSRFIAHAIDRTQMPILTQLFNQAGRFFIVHDRNDVPVGFVRLAKTGHDCEIVLVIGNRDTWGRRLGASAICEALKLAFLDMRARNVIAKINRNNTRSLGAFKHCGFLLERETATFQSFSMTSGRYLKQLRAGAMADSTSIHITEPDRFRLQELLELEKGPAVVELEYEVERAIVVDPKDVARDIVTMNSKVVMHLDDEEKEIDLVYPQEADDLAGKISVTSAVGAAILGYREGDIFFTIVSDRTRRIMIERVIYQPEAFGHFHL